MEVAHIFRTTAYLRQTLALFGKLSVKSGSPKRALPNGVSPLFL